MSAAVRRCLLKPPALAMLTGLRDWCGASARRRVLVGGVGACAGVGALVVLVSWIFGVHVLSTLVRAFFTAASNN